MPYTLRRRLRQSLIARYVHLRQRLERRIGSREDAADALQETWIRLESIGQGAVINNEDAYLLRMATNIAIDAHKQRYAVVAPTDIEELIHIADETQNLERHAIARLEAAQLLDLLRAMPERQRDILMASRVDGLSYAEIGKAYGISATMVGKEVRRALAYLEEQINARAGHAVDIRHDSRER